MKFNFTTEALARASGRRPWVTIGAWLVGIVVAVAIIATLLSGALTTEDEVTNNPESNQALELLAERLGESDGNIDEMVVVRSTTLIVDDPEYQIFVESLFDSLSGLGEEIFAGGVTYYISDDESLVSGNRHSTIIPLFIPKEAKQEIGRVHQVIDEASEKGKFEVYITGEATMEEELMAIAEEDLQKGEAIGISAALVVLILVFGAVAAALLPIILAIAAVIVAMGLTALVGQAIDLTFFVTNMITMMGLAVGIDYSLFIVSRFREERTKGLDKLDAITAAGATASRAVLFSGMTVVLALCGLLIFPLSIFQTMGIGSILVVIVAVFASLTLLPAVLSLLGDRVNSWKIPLIQRRRKGAKVNPEGGFWAWTARTVMRRPIVSLAIVLVLLATFIIPFFDLKQGFSGISALPDDLRSKSGFLILQEEFGFGQDAPAIIVIDGKTDSETIKEAIASLESDLDADENFISTNVVVHPEDDLSILYARLAGDPLSTQSMDALERLRNNYIPQNFADVEAEVLVAGSTAEIADFNQTTDTYTPIVFVFVLGLSFLLLTVVFRSIVVPITSIIMNLLSVGAAYGLLVLVFQKGFGAGLLGFVQVDAIETWLPLFLFSILFGLSMDYHVFLLSRIREQYNRGATNDDAVAFGLRSTGRLITGAALIMVAVFGGFALGTMSMMQQMGFGLAIAVFIDATIIRSILVPSVMRLLGDWNWYLPAWLSWLPRIGIGEGLQEDIKQTRKSKRPVVTEQLTPVPVTVIEAEENN